LSGTARLRYAADVIAPCRACSSFAASFVLLSACGDAAKTQDAPAAGADAKVVSRVAVEDVPEHSAAAMAEADKPQLVTTRGSLSATLNGHALQFETLTTGANAAVWAPATRVARVMVGGSDGDEAFPALRVLLEGVRLDKLELPATFTIGPKGDAKAEASKDPERPLSPPRPRIVYEIEARKIWEAGPDRGGSGTITIEAFEGKRIRGTFAGKLEPHSSAFGPPIEITDGRFEVDLRLNGVEPRTPAGPP